MLNSILISTEPVRLRLLQKEVTESQKAVVSYSFDRYPTAGELLRMIKTVEANLIFLDMEDQADAASLLETVHGCSPETSVIALVSGLSGTAHSTGTGITATLLFPCSMTDLEAALLPVEQSQMTTHAHLHAFLPAKAGSGCSTVVLNTASALADSLGRRVLLLEADLRSGSLSIAVNTKLTGSIQQAFDWGGADSFQWNDFVVPVGKLDLLLSDRTCPKHQPQMEDYDRILKFCSNRYESILVDLPELVNPGTAELVRKAHSVFVVCTQEILSLKLAEHRFQELQEWGVPAERIKVLVNRWHKSELPREDVVRLLKRPITAVFPNDYKTVRETIVNGRAVPLQSELGASFLQFASGLVGVATRKESTKRWPMAKMLRLLVRSQDPQPASGAAPPLVCAK